ncbi:MAG: alpha/beta fold hydrolase [Propionibacteriaceae bacterium]|nr:alpha/beta fold hydrolase [Propionibacteriaceae bacterium]
MRFESLAHGVVGAARAYGHWLAGPFEPMRAATETSISGCLLPALLWERAATPRHVLVIPGMSGGSSWCAPLRAFLTAHGHLVHQPETGALKGPNGPVADRLERQLTRLANGSRRITIIGWSAGGVFARQLALAAPEKVSALITLGTPVGGWWYAARPGTADQPMPVPTTAIFSRTDPLFAHRTCRQVPSPHCEDIEIVSSHLGMATHPTSLHAIADRLALREGQWHAYRPPLPGLASTTAYSEPQH